MSTTIIAAFVLILVNVVFPFFGIGVKTEELTQALTTIVNVIAPIWVWYQRTKLQRAPSGRGDVGALGVLR